MRRIFLTGASAGIGLATARALTIAGHKVWGTSRELGRLPTGLTNFFPVQLDLEDDRSLSESFARAEEAAGGRFDVLINNAGGGWFGPGSQIPASELRSQFQALALGPIQLIQAALPGLRAAPEGLVINVTSLAARLPLPFGAAYSAAKAALSVFTAGLQMEEFAARRMGEHRVTFVDLQPGDIETGFNRAMCLWSGLEDASDPRGAAVRASLEASNRSLASAPPPEHVAAAILRIVNGPAATAPLMRATGNVWQAIGGPLAYRFLTRRLLLWTIRKNCGL